MDAEDTMDEILKEDQEEEKQEQDGETAS